MAWKGSRVRVSYAPPIYLSVVISPHSSNNVDMKVYFHEIKDQELEYEFTEQQPWVMEVVGSLDERVDRIARPPNWRPRSRPTRVSFQLRKVDDLIHVDGKIDTQLYLLCSLCADGFSFPISTQFHALLTQSEIYGEAPREGAHHGKLDFDTSAFESDSDDDDLEESGPAVDFHASDFEVTVVKEPVIDLKEVLNEQLVLLIPMQPKPEKNEAGDCSKCGRDQLSFLQTDQEAPLKENPFSVLKNFKTKAGQDS